MPDDVMMNLANVWIQMTDVAQIRPQSYFLVGASALRLCLRMWLNSVGVASSKPSGVVSTA